MASTKHRFASDVYVLEKFPVMLFGYCTSADYSAIATATTDIKTANRSLGIDYIYYTATGVVKIGLKQAYHSILYADVVCEVADSSVASVDITDDDVDGSSPYVELTIRDHAGSAKDIPDDTILRFILMLRNSGLG